MSLHYCRKEWAVQFYYDAISDKIHIGVSKEDMRTATNAMDEYRKETGFEKYEITEYEQGRFLCTLRIGQLLKSEDASKFFLFSGTVIDEKTGITVAHGFDQVGEKVLAAFAQEMIGKCREKIDVIRLQSCKITADLAVIDLEPNFSVKTNTVLWSGTEIRVKMYRGESIPDNKRVMILDQDGRYRYGAIRRYMFSDRLAAEGYHNVLAVSSEDEMKEVAITKMGDSGALVMSTPEDNPDVVYVYGIVIARYNNEDKDTSLTIANHLPEVIRNVDSFHQQSGTQFPGSATDGVIDFTSANPTD